jgi:hypothetical protein
MHFTAEGPRRKWRLTNSDRKALKRGMDRLKARAERLDPKDAPSHLEWVRMQGRNGGAE